TLLFGVRQKHRQLSVLFFQLGDALRRRQPFFESPGHAARLIERNLQRSFETRLTRSARGGVIVEDLIGTRSSHSVGAHELKPLLSCNLTFACSSSEVSCDNSPNP